jgi:hypothetical protein
MNYLHACDVFTKHELRAIAKIRKLRWYSYLHKRELAFRLFGMDSRMNRVLCTVNQMRRYRTPEPNDPKQWELLNV